MKRRPARKAGEPGRDWIVERTAALLKTQGYLRTPLSEIMKATGMQKGGLYHHFDSRDALVIAAFQATARSVGQGLVAALAGEKGARRKLTIMVRYPLETYWRGGCPVGNLAIEADHAHPKLARTAREAMDWLLGLFTEVIQEGMKSGELARGDAKAKAIRMVAAMEGGILLANLYKDPAHLETVVRGMEAHIRSGLG